MGGQLHRHELVIHGILLADVEAVRRFSPCSWLGYFLQLTEFNEEVAPELMGTFEEGQATVWGLTVVATKEKIAEVIGLPFVGEHYPNEHDARSS